MVQGDQRSLHLHSTHLFGLMDPVLQKHHVVSLLNVNVIDALLGSLALVSQEPLRWCMQRKETSLWDL